LSKENKRIPLTEEPEGSFLFDGRRIYNVPLDKFLAIENKELYGFTCD
jgi:hypothetical protein